MKLKEVLTIIPETQHITIMQGFFGCNGYKMEIIHNAPDVLDSEISN